MIQHVYLNHDGENMTVFVQAIAQLNSDLLDIRQREIKARTSQSGYSDKIFLAVSNIAKLAENIAKDKGSCLSKILNGPALLRNFNFLGEKTYVPNITDDKTYQIGLALLKFLNAAISDEDASGIFPAGRLEQMQGILADRVVEYIPIASDKIFESELFLSDAM